MGSYPRVRVSLIGFNVLALLGGLVILSIGIWVQVEKGDYVAIADSDTGLTGALLIIIVGGVTTLISLIGFLGAVKKSRALLWLFFSVLVLLIIVEIIAFILAVVYREKVEDEFYDDMKKTLLEYAGDAEGVTDAWNWAQQKFECCGVDGYKDWILALAFNPKGSHRFVPDSCCQQETTGCGDFTATNRTIPDLSKIYTKGCFTELREFIKDHLLAIGTTALAFLFIQLIVITLTLILAVSITSSSTVV